MTPDSSSTHPRTPVAPAQTLIPTEHHPVRWLAGLPLLLLTLCGASPGQQGTTVTMGTGYADQDVPTGCGAVRTRSTPLYGNVSHTYANGLTATAEGTLSNLLDRSGVASNIALRLGYQHRYFGFEAGPTVIMNPLVSSQWVPFPSVSVWGGKPELVYGWGRMLAGPYTPDSFWHLGAVGVGRKTDQYQVELGLPLMYAQSLEYWPLFELSGSYRVAPELWLGGVLGTTFGGPGSDSNHLLLTLSWRPGRQLARQSLGPQNLGTR